MRCRCGRNMERRGGIAYWSEELAAPEYREHYYRCPNVAGCGNAFSIERYGEGWRIVLPTAPNPISKRRKGAS